MKDPEIPQSTYRLQFNREFTFSDAIQVIPYLEELGISHCYASPYLRARPGSLHGYDIVDHRQINPEIGTGEEYERFVALLDEHGLGQILDIVPNHMVDISRKVVAVCDSSKFTRRSLSSIVPPNAIHHVITDRKILKSDQQNLKDFGVQVTIV